MIFQNMEKFKILNSPKPYKIGLFYFGTVLTWYKENKISWKIYLKKSDTM